MNKAQDPEYRDYTIERVIPGADGWEVGFDRSAVCWVPDHGVEPVIGKTMRLYGKGWGYTIRGIDIDGQEVFYRTEAEERTRFLEQQRQREIKQRQEYESQRPELDAKIAALPDIFQQRIKRFRRVRPDFGWQHEAYELFTCEEAVKIANHCRTPDEVEIFSHLPYDEQRNIISDQHSGNTFGAACRLAYVYLRQPAAVPFEHGALCPLVGCEEYGCYAAVEAVHP